MIWGDFKKAVGKLGVKDDWQIEISVSSIDDKPEDIDTELICPNLNDDFEAILIFTV